MFLEEYNLLKNNKQLPKRSKLNSLSPFLDSDDLIRVGGRLRNSYYSYDVKHPIVLCAKHHITKTLFLLHHKVLMHAGPQLLLSNIRQNYWTIDGRNLARKTVHACVRCFRFKATSVQPIMGDLPNERTHLVSPFLTTGVDYAGPVLILNRKGKGSRLTKSYICVFICFAVKAVHLELVTDLTKEAYLACLNRFTSRRGKPETIYSDNVSTFIGASNELAQFLKSSVDYVQAQLVEQGPEDSGSCTLYWKLSEIRSQIISDAAGKLLPSSRASCCSVLTAKYGADAVPKEIPAVPRGGKLREFAHRWHARRSALDRGPQ
ncbi:uncharacterized protein LOC128198939 isoform X2 [Bicyclus anynana]|uniref:Uncharacterized protein LOC128198939 isoform X2 n=1 Tax=Bicyclus anynana TaxID=110368 RepID=A0ABM3LUL6_BICAN|nr:uncharacterized protein LOC128198939 isoform X2 [Bicyclus anynana]